MRHRNFWLACLLCTCDPSIAQNVQVSADQIVARVQTNTASLMASLPDFVCNERSISQEFKKRKIQRELRLDSVIRSTRRANEGTENDFYDSREILSIDGRPAAGRTVDPPLKMSNSTAGSVAAMFAAANVRCSEFRLAGSSMLRGKPVQILEATVKADAKSLGGACASKRPGATSISAWIDPETMQVVRIGAGGLPAHPDNRQHEEWRYSWWVDFAPVTIDDKPFWLPISERVEVTNHRDPAVRLLYTAEFSNFHKFVASARVLPEDDGSGGVPERR